MNVLKKLKQSSESSKPYFGLAKLSHGYHKVFNFRECHGKYGRGIITELEKEIIFLPQYLTEKITEQDVIDLNSSNEALYIFFGGQHKKKK